jgi:hypothetical protein
MIAGEKNAAKKAQFFEYLNNASNAPVTQNTLK